MSKGNKVENMDEFQFKEVGLDFSKKTSSGAFFQEDLTIKELVSFLDGIEIMSIQEAIKRYDWVLEYLGKPFEANLGRKIKVNLDDLTGYFIRSLPNTRVDLPVQICFYLKNVRRQKTYNMVVVEEGSQLNVISGCLSHRNATGSHVGSTEYFIKRNAKLTFTMIHSWNQNVRAIPKSAALVEDNATFISNYIVINPASHIKANPMACLNSNARATFNSIIVGLKGSYIDLGVKVLLNGAGSCAEITSRAVSKGGNIIARGCIIGKAEKTRGHLDCKGLMLSNHGQIHAIPELEARNPHVELSHEAAIGKIADEEIFYLMTRGLSRDEATSIVVRGFMDVEIKGLPKVLRSAIKETLRLVEKSLF